LSRDSPQPHTNQAETDSDSPVFAPFAPFAASPVSRTCRQSDKPGDGVCNKWGQAHDIKNLFISDGSQFTTSAAENPTLTIVTLAIRQADYIADQCAKKNI
jgi:choline dehydrogenase-like flavoprotein